jgi:hypothetical protein
MDTKPHQPIPTTDQVMAAIARDIFSGPAGLLVQHAPHKAAGFIIGRLSWRASLRLATSRDGIARFARLLEAAS